MVKPLPVIACWLLSVSAVLFASGADASSFGTAQGPKLHVSARFGLDGFFRLGDWMPVLVELENEGPPTQLTVGVPLPPQPGVWTMVTMPSRSHKRIAVYVPLRGAEFLRRLESVTGGGNPTPTLALEAYAGRALVKRVTHRFDPADRSVYSMAVVADRPLPRGFLKDSEVTFFSASGDDPLATGRSPLQPMQMLPGSMRYIPLPATGLPDGRALPLVVLNLVPRDLPDHAAGLESLDCLAVSVSLYNRLPAAQRLAVQVWVEQGGVLLLFGGAAVELNSANTQALCPARAVGMYSVGWLSDYDEARSNDRKPSSRKQIREEAIPHYRRFPPPLTALPGSFLLNALKLNPGSRADLEGPHGPLLVTARRGFGGAGYVAVDLLSEPIRRWPRSPELWLRMVRLLAQRFQGERVSDVAPRANAPGHFASAHLAEDPGVASFLRKLRGVKPPPRWALWAMAGLYVAVFGPLNVFLVRRVRRSERGWLTTPALSVGFALFLLLCGFQWGGGRSVVTQLSLLECRSGSTSAREETVFGLFAPVHGRYTLRLNSTALFVEDKSAEEENRGDTPSPSRYLWRNGVSANAISERFAPAAEGDSMVQTARGTVLTSLPMGVWGHKRLRVARAVHLEGAVRVEFAARGSVGRASTPRGGVVRNATALRLCKVMLADGRFDLNLGDLAPRQERVVRADQWHERPPGGAASVGADDATLDNIYRRLPVSYTRSGVTLFAKLAEPLLRIDAGGDVQYRQYGLLVVHSQPPW